MENYKNFINVKIENFYSILKTDIIQVEGVNFPQDGLNFVINEISNFFLKKFGNIQMEVNYYRDNNITSNIVYFLNISPDERFVVKIQRENYPLPYDMQLKYLNLMYEKELIPIQYLNFKYEHLKISIEEFIYIPHHNEADPYNIEIIRTLKKDLAKLNTISVIEIQNDLMNFELFYLKYLLKIILPTSIDNINYYSDYFKNNIEEESQIYFCQNSETFQKIINFFKSIPEFVAEIISDLKNKNKFVLSHIDLHIGNFFITKEGKLKLIDFEDLSLCFAGFDLANHIIESTYLIDNDKTTKYPFYTLDVSTFTNEFILETFKEYIDNLNNNLLALESCIKFETLELNDIYRLMLLSIIKSVIEYIHMVDKSVYLKTEIDFILLIKDRLDVFHQLFNKIK